MKVALFFGSKSDTEIMKKAGDVLKAFDVSYKAFVLSAHRSGDLLKERIREVVAEAASIIAGAGLATFSGVIASL